MRLAAISKCPTIFVWTHDSIGVGEDGPTHQPVEHVPSLRLIPGLDVVRPGDANETAAAWVAILKNHDRPAGIILSRQNLRVFDRSEGSGFAGTEGVAKGGYVLAEASSEPQVILVATGSEVEIAAAARDTLEAAGVPTRLISMPCVEWYVAQPEEYKASILPAGVPKVVIEAAQPIGWRDVLDGAVTAIGIDHFGASADAATLYREFGLTAEAVVEAAKALA